ncbi:aldose epimerase family protein [Sporolactobacillus putidus]|uniref:Aldose 1-epimerase n=1 Tax=Sporolactobacillus putidus TaxID=492735 RepID=A0A917S882_9BACL|nr:aldose epimerase family protein [Sporolactobacillus putidus]GGL60952.1 galactose mutarotase [Sporolactobacillus putidus]
MKISKAVIGSIADEPIMQYTLENDHQVQVVCMSYAATWQGFMVPDQDDKLHNMILQFDDVNSYLTNPFHVGHTIGRVGGRIKNGCFTINNVKYHVSANEGPNLIHGGDHGFSSWNWQAATESSHDAVKVTFSRKITTQDDGFPGDIEAKISYILDNQDKVTIQFYGQSNADTLFNPMTHVYFNLSNDQETIMNHELQINSRQHVETDGQKLPTGRLLENHETAFDFSKPVTLQSALAQLQRESGKTQFDDAFKLADREQPAVVIRDRSDHRQISVYSDRNGVVMFTANPDVIGKSKEWEASHPYNGVAIEAQTLPDAIHHPGFGDIVLSANQAEVYTVQYHYEEIR